MINSMLNHVALVQYCSWLKFSTSCAQVDCLCMGYVLAHCDSVGSLWVVCDQFFQLRATLARYLVPETFGWFVDCYAMIYYSAWYIYTVWYNILVSLINISFMVTWYKGTIITSEKDPMPYIQPRTDEWVFFVKFYLFGCTPQIDKFFPWQGARYGNLNK
jgi:hypothetical protein